jgi:DNA-directed RNA polymerase subunit beta'
MMLGQLLPKHPAVPFDVVNKLMTKKEISDDRRRLPPLRSEGDGDLLRPHHGARLPHAFKAGISFGKDDMVIPENKWKIVEETRALVKEFEQQYNDGLITQGEKYNKVVDAWAKCTDVAEEMMAASRP